MWGLRGVVNDHPASRRPLYCLFVTGSSAAPRLSIVVVAYDMARELPRTLRSLVPGYQRGIDAADYEIIVVDNGSPEPLAATLVDDLPVEARLERISPAPPAPGHAANVGIGLARGELVGLFLDGARMASPGLLQEAVRARRLAERPVIASLAWHLGDGRHMDASARGYDQHVEDELLDSIEWERDGYRLFAASTLAASSSRGWFGPMGESNGLFMPAALWQELGGIDERFASPGGGLSNHDLYRRACELPGAQLVVLLGEGTFHQIHGGAATSNRVQWDDLQAEYVSLRGRRYAPPDVDALYLGRVPEPALGHFQHSLEWLREHPRRR